jgi:alpha-glucosidase
MAEVVYQIFVDRFHAGRVIAPLPERAAAEGLTRREWHSAPEEPPTGRDLFGGDLDGVVAKLDHIAALGADAIYLTPIFRAPSNHKYDTADYLATDEHFGGDEAFERLARATRERGLGLISSTTSASIMRGTFKSPTGFAARCGVATDICRSSSSSIRKYAQRCSTSCRTGSVAAPAAFGSTARTISAPNCAG